ncbi:heme ABC exporter ATP-binding protein CcmA [Oceanibium sediminis]|uniref:heme ABC exporter ATP-binding protein CcmA n=1 Tax=Oceanibium sediminis TaxID=2026339 RepID=UPI000DD37283|nr:heme ABC exporter ATP-binding protein CcmA [Oceanibium sediminis]
MTLVATDITCQRGGQTLFAPAGFRLEPGRATQLTGPNGIGKTTLLRSLAGLAPLAGGRVTLDGQPLGALEGALIYTGHLDALKPALSVAENLRFWAALEDCADIAPALEAFQLTDLADRPAARLSAGQKRRAGLARLCVSRARLWLMDEPTTALDTASVARLASVLEHHLSGGGMALIATHQPLPIPVDTLGLSPAPAATPESADPFLAGSFH